MSLSIKEQYQMAEADRESAVKELNRLYPRYQREVVRPERLHLIGTCYRYLNSYGSDKRWWMYVKIVDIKGSEPVLVTVQHTTNNEVLIRNNDYGSILCHDGSVQESYQSITPAHYRKAVKSIMATAAKVAAM